MCTNLRVDCRTTASFVSDLRGAPLQWATATSAPCESVCKPVRVDSPADLLPAPTNRYDPSILWWRHELLHRSMLRDCGDLAASFQLARDRLESEWIADVPSSDDAFIEAESLEGARLDAFDRRHPDRRPPRVRPHWRELDAAAQMPELY